jgi:four helix bundle protein
MDHRHGDFQRLEVWRLGKQLVLSAYDLTRGFPPSETYGLGSQIRRAAVSVPGNIAEAFGRYHFLDRVRFFLNARGSLNELKSHLIIARELKLTDSRQTEIAIRDVEALSIKLNNLITANRLRQKR